MDKLIDMPRRDEVLAWGVHAFTAMGAVLGFLALIAAAEGRTADAFLWLGAAMVVDGIDGPLARRARVLEIIPGFDGAMLDCIIDYLTYVIVPAVILYSVGMVPGGLNLLAAAAIMACACYTFARTDMKTDDCFFRGFPAIWNIVVFCFLVLDTGPWTNLGVIALCCWLTFTRVKFVHPIRVRTLRPLTLLATLLWSLASLRIVLGYAPEVAPRDAAPVAWAVFVATALYFAAISLGRSLRPDPPA